MFPIELTYLLIGLNLSIIIFINRIVPYPNTFKAKLFVVGINAAAIIVNIFSIYARHFH